MKPVELRISQTSSNERIQPLGIIELDLAVGSFDHYFGVQWSNRDRPDMDSNHCIAYSVKLWLIPGRYHVFDINHLDNHVLGLNHNIITKISSWLATNHGWRQPDAWQLWACIRRLQREISQCISHEFMRCDISSLTAMCVSHAQHLKGKVQFWGVGFHPISRAVWSVSPLVQPFAGRRSGWPLSAFLSRQFALMQWHSPPWSGKRGKSKPKRATPWHRARLDFIHKGIKLSWELQNSGKITDASMIMDSSDQSDPPSILQAWRTFWPIDDAFALEDRYERF